jgi:putative transposase
MIPGVASYIADPHRLDASSSHADSAGASIPLRRSVHQRRRLIGYWNASVQSLHGAWGLTRRARAGHPEAAASLREGLEETLTVVRLGVSAVLRRTLATTNPIESALSVTRRVTARVTRWRDGDMRKRWCAAGLLRAEAKFRRVEGRRAMPTLPKALGVFRARTTGWKQT